MKELSVSKNDSLGKATVPLRCGFLKIRPGKRGSCVYSELLHVSHGISPPVGGAEMAAAPQRSRGLASFCNSPTV